MFFDDSQLLDPDLIESENQYDDDEGESAPYRHHTSAQQCSQGHASTLSLQANQGGSICLVCLSNLVTNPRSPTFHVSHALSQLSLALSHPPALLSLLDSRPHFLVSPLIRALDSFDHDEPIARHVIHLVTTLCGSGHPNAPSVHYEFFCRVARHLSSSGALSWSPRQVFMLHCCGVLLNCCTERPNAKIKDEEALVSNLVAGLQLPSEEIRGEILFVLYRLLVLPNGCNGIDKGDVFFPVCPKLFRLTLEALMKTQNDTVRVNSVALLTILVQQVVFDNAYGICSMSSDEADNIMQTIDDPLDEPPLDVLFAEAIKGPLLSSDKQLQVNILDLTFCFLSREGTPAKSIQLLVEENIVDYVFEVLRLSGYEDPLLSSCILVLDMLSKAEKGFKERLIVGLSTLIPAFCHVSEVPFHSAQYQTIKLLWIGITDCPGLLSTSQVEELICASTRMFKRHTNGEMGIPPETFIMVCLIFASLFESSSFHGSNYLVSSVLEATSYTILACLNVSEEDPRKILHALILLKDAYGYSHQEVSIDDYRRMELRNSIVGICSSHLLPWIMTAMNDVDENVVLELLETFHHILLHNSDIQATQLAKLLVTSSWFSFCFGFLGLFPSEKMKYGVYLLLSSLVDIVLGNNSGQPIREAVLNLPTDPNDLLFLLGQKSSQSTVLSLCQSAVLLILHASSLYDDRLADEKTILASLEQYIIVNGNDLLCRATSTSTVIHMANLYGLHREFAEMNGQIHYSTEAEKILFHLLTEYDWDLPSSRFHVLSMKWLFQQDNISKVLCFQILKFCRNCSWDETQAIVSWENSQVINMQDIAELASTDTYVARLLVCLLLQLLGEEGRDLDILSVINLLIAIIDISPISSDQLCINGVGTAIRTLFQNPIHSSPGIFTALLLLIFKILHSVNPEALVDDEAWLSVTVKLVDCISSKMLVKCLSDEVLQVIAIFSLIMRQSTYGALLEASKAIVFSTSLASIINRLIHDLCTQGPALFEYEIGTSSGRSLILVILLWYFSLKSLRSVLPGDVQWEILLNPSNGSQPLTIISISCQDLCRLMHFGSPLIKLIASYSLLELITILSEQIGKTNVELNFSSDHLMSIIAILQGLIFDCDRRIAINCSRCLLKILGWESLDMKEKRVIAKNTWFRLIAEEMAMSFAAPCLATKCLIDHHKPAILVVIALLKLQNPPGWMSSVILEPCISGIIRNFLASNVSVEMVILFRELLNSGFLNVEQIACLNRIFQECRICMYTDGAHLDGKEDHVEKGVKASYDLVGVCECLIHLMSLEASLGADYGGSQPAKQRLSEEIEMFLSLSAAKQIS